MVSEHGRNDPRPLSQSGPREGGGGPRRPGGRPSKRRPSRGVIWRRRILALVLVVALLGVAIRGGWALTRLISEWAGDTFSAGAGPSEPPGEAEETEEAPVEPQACDPADLDVALDESPSDEGRAFAVTVENVSDVPCLVDAGAASLVLTVHSGGDRVWSSADCPAGNAERMLLLDSGDTAETSVTWNGTRSEPGCSTEGEAGSGTYRAAVSLGDEELDARARFER